jgi:hypothetical protein
MHDYVVDQLQAVKGNWSRVAEETGISKRTIEKIARREFRDPGVSFIERLNKHFRRRRAQ